LGQSTVRLQVQADGTLKASDFFAPYDASTLDSWDADFGSGGPVALPSQYFGNQAHPHLFVGVGKQGYVYLLDRDDLGGSGMGANGSDQVIQRIGPYGGVWSRPGVWPGDSGYVYIPTASSGTTPGGSSEHLEVYHYGIDGSGKPTLAHVATSGTRSASGRELPSSPRMGRARARQSSG
jgi:iron transport multicopper oxidase